MILGSSYDGENMDCGLPSYDAVKQLPTYWSNVPPISSEKNRFFFRNKETAEMY
jgi:hypothetical protein